MSLYNGSDKIKDLYIGPTKIKELYVGSTKVYSSQQELPWTQPVLSANGTIGGNSFACAASSEYNSNMLAYKAFDGNSSSYWYASSSSLPQWLELYNPIPLKITEIQIDGGIHDNLTGSYDGQPTSFQIQVSEDGVNWTTIYNGTNSSHLERITVNINENNGYGYWRLYITGMYTNYGSFGYTGIRELTITATQIV